MCVSGHTATRAIALGDKLTKEIDAKAATMDAAGVNEYTTLLNESQIPASVKVCLPLCSPTVTAHLVIFVAINTSSSSSS